jgi:hypothetical protein
MKIVKILSYSLKINPVASIFQLKLKLASLEEPVEINVKNAMELSSIAELLRNEKNTFFDLTSNDIVIGWEPTGENDPKFVKYS